MEWIKRRWVDIVLVGLAQAAVAGIATWTFDKAIAHDTARDIGIICVWLAVIAAGAVVLTRTPWRQPEASAHSTDMSEGRADIPPGVEFYEDRQALNKMTGGFLKELKAVSEAWLATYTGIHVETTGAHKLRKITRLILLDPESRGFPRFANEFEREPHEIANVIRLVTRVCTDFGTDVRWCDGIITGMLVGDPDSDAGWVRIEVAFPCLEHRTGFRVTRMQHPDVFLALRDSFVKLWESSNCRRPPEDAYRTRPRTPGRREALGQLLLEGQHIQQQCGNEKEPAPSAQAQEWADKTEGYLAENLGESYIARFRSSAGLPMTANSISSLDHRNLWASLHVRLARLTQFVEELSQ